MAFLAAAALVSGAGASRTTTAARDASYNHVVMCVAPAGWLPSLPPAIA